MTEELKERIEEIANDNDWSVNMYASTTDGTEYIEFESYTDAGQDLIVTVDVYDDVDMLGVSAKIYEYAENFDPDYEASLWIGEDGHGINGAPYHMGDVLEDMVSAKQMIYDLSDAMKD